MLRKVIQFLKCHYYLVHGSSIPYMYRHYPKVSVLPGKTLVSHVWKGSFLLNK